MKKLICFFVLYSALCANVFAQEVSKSAKVDEMRTKKWLFLVEKAKLSATEIAQIQPIFVKYEKQMWEQHKKNRDFFKKNLDKENGMQINYAALNDRYIEMEVKQSQLLKSYHLQLSKTVLPETLYRFYKAEREFKRILLHRFPEHKKHKGND